MEYDHRMDEAIFYNKAYVERKLSVIEDTYEKYKDMAAVYAGPAVIETFGELPFKPDIKESVIKLSKKQQEMSVSYAGRNAAITNKYIPRDKYSFTIIAYPIPEIGDNFEEIFAEIVKVNTLDNELYKSIQQSIIDELDKATYVHVVGKAHNKTDIKVVLHQINQDKETNFENCLADVNIPVGEVFTSPVLTGTDGVLNVSQVYLNELKYTDLLIEFENGKIKSYSCKNFDDEDKNKAFIKENLMFNHETLPIGEFAIGTNTTAYVMAHKYDILYKELCGLKSRAKYRRIFLGTGIVLCSLVLLFAVIAVGRNMADNRGQETGITPGTTTTPQETTPEELPEQQTTSASTETEGQKTSEEETTSAAPETTSPTSATPTSTLDPSEATTPEQTTEPDITVSVLPEIAEIPEGMRFMLSYGDGVHEFYEFFGGVSQRISELNDPECDYFVAYVDNEGFTDSEEYGCYTINEMPKIARSITFVGEKEKVALGTYTLRIVSAEVSYPIVTYVDMQIDNCEFEDLTVDGSKGASVELLNETIVGNAALRNNARLSIVSMQRINISRYTVEDMNSKLYFNRGSCCIKDLVGYQGFIRVNMGRSYDTEEKVVLVTDSDISLAQFEISRDNKDKFEIVLNKNSEGQNVLSIVPRN